MSKKYNLRSSRNTTRSRTQRGGQSSNSTPEVEDPSKHYKDAVDIFKEYKLNLNSITFPL